MVGIRKGKEGSGRDAIEVLTSHLPEGIEENHESLRITSVSVEIRTDHFPNKSLQLFDTYFRNHRNARN
jgi:hypothetical protein